MAEMSRYDYRALVMRIMLAARENYSETYIGHVIEMLKDELTWEGAVALVDRLVALGKSELKERLIHHINTVKKELQAKAPGTRPGIQKQVAELPWKVRQARYQLHDVLNKINTEILLWGYYMPPLKFRGVEILHTSGNRVNPVDIDTYAEMGFPKTSSNLMDFFLRRYYEKMKESDAANDEYVLINWMMEFLNEMYQVRAARDQEATQNQKNRTKEFLQKWNG